MTKALLKHERKRDSRANYPNCWMCKKDWKHVVYKCRDLCTRCYSFYKSYNFRLPTCDKCKKEIINTAIVGKLICNDCFLKLKEKILSLYEKELSLAKIRKAIDNYLTEVAIYYWLQKWEIRIITKEDRKLDNRAKKILGGDVKKEYHRLHWEEEKSLGDIAKIVRADRVTVFNSFQRLGVHIRPWLDSVQTERYREKRKILFIKNWVTKGQIGSVIFNFLKNPNGQFSALTENEINQFLFSQLLNQKWFSNLELNFLVQLAKLENEVATRTIFERYRPLVGSIAKRFYLPGADYQDLFQEGWFGLWKAIRNYDSSLNSSFIEILPKCVSTDR